MSCQHCKGQLHPACPCSQLGGDFLAGSLATCLQDLQVSLDGNELNNSDLCQADFIFSRQLRLTPVSVGRPRPSMQALKS